MNRATIAFLALVALGWPFSLTPVTAADIIFVLKDTYTLGETAEVKIKNIGVVSYLYRPSSRIWRKIYCKPLRRKLPS